MIATYFDHLMFISRASSVGEKLLSAGSLADFFAPSVLFFYIVHLFSDELNWFHLYHLAWNCFPSRITSPKLASTYPIYLGGTLLTAFRAFDFPMSTIMGTESQLCNACRAINDEITFSLAATDLLMLINFVSSAKASIYSFVNDQLIFLKCEQNNTNTSVIKEDFNDCLFFLIYDWAKMLWGHIISFVIIQNQTLSFDCHSTRNLLWCRTFRRDDKALNGCIICESITEFTWDQIYQVLLGCCWIQAHVFWWQLPVQWEMRWSSKSTNPCISCVRLDAIWHVTIKCQKDVWLRDYFSNLLLYPIYQVFH